MLGVSPVAEEPRHVDAPHGLDMGHGAPCVFSGCSGFFHAAGGPTGVVLCAPWGVEDLAMRKNWRLLAEAIAAAGYPCLRFDYPGTGNALGHATEPSSIETWIEAINSAADFVRRVNGVRRFVYVGQSLGATLAAEAARRRSDVVGLHVITPVVKARAYARDLSVTAKRAADKLGIASGLGPNEGLNIMGFALSVPMFESLQALDLMKIDRLDTAHVTIYDQLDRTTSAEAVEHLRKIGADVAIEPAVPFHMIMSDAATTQPPPVAPERIVARIRAAHPIIFPAPTREPLLKSVLTGDGFREEPIRFGRDLALFGILCGPLRPHEAAPAVILLNRGLDPHIGWRRAAVDQARGLAAAGIASLRIDASGLGESRDEPGRANLKYSDRLVSDIMAAVDALTARGHARIALAGVGSGAYMALAAAQADPRVSDVIAVNAERFVWNPKETIEDVVGFGRHAMSDHVGDFRSLGGLKALIRRRERIAPAMMLLARRSVKNAMAHVPPRLRANLLRDPMQARVEHLFGTFAARGTRISLVFSAGDPGLVELRTYFGPNGRNLRGTNVCVTILPGADHNLTTNAASTWMLDHMIDVVGERRTHVGARPPSRRAREPRHAVCPT